MKLSQEIFAIKLYEMEQQYGKIQTRIRICGQEDQDRIREELRKAQQEYEEYALTLQESAKGSRSLAVAKLAQTQAEFSEKMEALLKNGQLAQYLHSEKNAPAEDRAEAAALYAEYAMDYAVQAIQYALIAALSAMDLQMCAEKPKGVS